MDKRDIKKPNPNNLNNAAKIICDLVNIVPTKEFFNSIEKTKPEGFEMDKEKLNEIYNNHASFIGEMSFKQFLSALEEIKAETRKDDNKYEGLE